MSVAKLRAEPQQSPNTSHRSVFAQTTQSSSLLNQSGLAPGALFLGPLYTAPLSRRATCSSRPGGSLFRGPFAVGVPSAPSLFRFFLVGRLDPPLGLYPGSSSTILLRLPLPPPPPTVLGVAARAPPPPPPPASSSTSSKLSAAAAVARLCAALTRLARAEPPPREARSPLPRRPDPGP